MRTKFLKKINSICPVGTLPGILYDNSKVHKTAINNTPNFQHILSVIKASTYFLAKYLNSILSSLMNILWKIPLNLLKKLSIMIIIFIWLALMLSPSIPLKETIKNCVSNLFVNNFYSGHYWSLQLSLVSSVKLTRKDLCHLLKLELNPPLFFIINFISKFTELSGFTFGSHSG